MFCELQLDLRQQILHTHLHSLGLRVSRVTAEQGHKQNTSDCEVHSTADAVLSLHPGTWAAGINKPAQGKSSDPLWPLQHSLNIMGSAGPPLTPLMEASERLKHQEEH